MSIFGRDNREALFYEPKEDGSVQCTLCNHRCRIQQGRTGICGVRENKGGKLYTQTYGRASSIAPDPIEKKPLYHFLPGTRSLSYGSIGCNLKCTFCQNYGISQEYQGLTLKKIEPKDVVSEAKKLLCDSVAWTYNEPTMWYEFTLEASKLVKKAGLANIYVSNGYMSPEALMEISPYLDAMNIDVKAFKPEFYLKYAGAKLENVLRTCEIAVEQGIFLELTYLIIPGLNDDPNEIKQYSEWIVEKLGDETPCHFSRFHPDYKMMSTPRTPLETMYSAREIAGDAGLKHIYLGNMPYTSSNDPTMCPHCGAVLINRRGYHTSGINVKDGKCGSCGKKVNVITEI